MAQITATSGDVGLQSKLVGSSWTIASSTVTFALNLPKYSVVDSAVLSYKASSPMSGGSSFTADGQKTGVGTHSINISVSNEAQSRDVTFSFSGSGTSNTVSALTVSNISLTVVYTVKNPCPFQRSENGVLVKYRLYRAESGVLVPYSVYRAENGSLVKY